MADETSDTAGKLMGWSVGSGFKKKPMDKLVQFPCDFTFKIIGEHSTDFADQILQTIKDYRGSELKVVDHETKTSRKSNYTSLTLTLHVEVSQDIYDVYEACQQLPYVKFVL